MTGQPASTEYAATLARTALTLAAEIDAADNRIKEAILAAARTGDCDRVIDIVTRWQTGPATEALRGLA